MAFADTSNIVAGRVIYAADVKTPIDEVDAALTGVVEGTQAVDALLFNVEYATGGEPVGTLFWNTVDGTLDVRLENSVTLQLGQEIHFYGKAQGDVANGAVCQFAGVQGDHILFKTAVGSEIAANPNLLIGLAIQAVVSGEYGYVTWFGKVSDVVTTGFAVNDILYFDEATSALVNTEPTTQNAVITVAAVIKASTGSSANGVLLVRPTVQHFGYTRLTVSGTLKHTGSQLGFYNATPITKPTVTGSRSDNTALASLLEKLELLGLIVDDSTV